MLKMTASKLQAMERTGPAAGGSVTRYRAGPFDRIRYRRVLYCADWTGGQTLSARTMSVVIPAYNEMGNLENAVKDVVLALQTFDDCEVIIVNDGSQDGTREV